MALNILQKIKPVGTFPAVDAEDVLMPDGTRLSEFSEKLPTVTTEDNDKVMKVVDGAWAAVTEDADGGTPVFDLAALGLTAIPLAGGNASVGIDTAEIRAALDKGAVTFKIPINVVGATALGTVTMVGVGVGVTYQCIGNVLFADEPAVVMLNMEEELLTAAIIPTKDYVGIPAVSSADDGKVMKVVDGAWTVAEDAGGVSSWNDLEDKPFYEESGEYFILIETQLDGFEPETLGSGLTCYLKVHTPALPALALGETYCVKWDGETYTCPVQDSSSFQGGMIPLALGNCSLIGLEGNNEPFVIGCSDTATFLFCMDNAPSHTVAIYKEFTFVEPLDPKFLPSAASIDLSAFASDGRIVETFADGSVVTTVMEFDANGQPTKITDSNGKVTTLTW